MKKILFYAAMVAMTFTSCAKKEEAKTTYAFAGKTLSLVELPGIEYKSEAVNRAVTIQFEADNTFSGATGCNLMNGTFYVNADTLNFPQPVAMTRMMCDDASNAVEEAITNLVNNANRYTIEGERVSVFNNETLLGVFAISTTVESAEAQATPCPNKEEHKCQQPCEAHKHEHKCQHGQAQAQPEAPAKEETPVAKPAISAKPIQAGNQNIAEQAKNNNVAAAPATQATAAQAGAKQPAKNTAEIQNMNQPLQKTPTKVSNLKVVKKTNAQ